MNIYIGNFPLGTSEAALRKKFEAYGRVTAVNIIKDKNSGRALGFGFIEMPGRKQAKEAIEALDRKKFKDRVVMVAETKERIERRKNVEKE